MKLRRLGSGIISIALLLLFGFAVLKWQSISDWWRLRGYIPPEVVAQLATSTTMLDSSRNLFYVNRPVLANKQSFNEYCRNNERTIVLGCYIQQDGIYLLDVTDDRLKGVEEVTAAHELLHAAYDRLSTKEREKVDRMTGSAYQAMGDERIKSTIELYRSQDPSIVPNELHSILGTEVRNLSLELEDYYRQYFADRLQVVGFSEQYEQAFTERRNQIIAFDSQLATLKQQIDSLKLSLEQTDSELRSQRSKMNSLRSSGQTEAYNAEVPSYNSKVNRYNRDIDTLSGLVLKYNEVVQKRNAIASEEAELVEAIDSREVVPDQR
ncbi:hypothetical protein H0V99_02770 [Candidatus Saccharibacteria bacterium]|nr:hypothetical protein [Candidatus Saccharibacteria bacterium]